MRNFSINRIFGNNSANTVSASKNKRKRSRTLRIEELESRDLLSADLFNAISAAYTDLELGDDWERYNFIEISADNLSDVALRNAIAEAGTTTQDDIIVIHTTATQNTITLGGTELAININAAQFGSVTIVSLGAEKLTIDADKQSRVLDISGTVTLAGLVVANGNISGSDSISASGGGIRISDGMLTITDCEIVGNTARFFGGGIHSVGGTLTITNSTISENTAESNGGGGISIRSNNTLAITNSTISGNFALYSGGGILGDSGSTLTITNCIVSENSADGSGGGIYSIDGTLTTITNSTISKNTARSGGGVLSNNTLIISDSTITGNVATSNSNVSGGGIFINSGTLAITNSIIFGNAVISTSSADTFGGGICVHSGATATIVNTIITENSALYGGGIYGIECTLTITNCTISNNSGSGIYYFGIHDSFRDFLFTINNSIVAHNFNSASTSPDIFLDNLLYSNVTVTGYNNFIGNGSGQTSFHNGVNGNIVATSSSPISPMFVDFYGDNFRLSAGSPAINAGNNALTVDARGIPLLYDLDGNHRIANGTVDMGAYEHGSTYARPPVTPSNFRSTAKTSNSITFQWNTQNELTEYTLQYRVAGTQDWETWNAPAIDDTSATIIGLLANTAYNFQLTATNANGSVSSTANAMTNVATPTAPTNIRSTDRTTNSITLAWNSVISATSYEIQHSTDGITWTNVPVAGTSATIYNLTADIAYQFQVLAVNDDGKSDWSQPISVATLLPLPIELTNTGLSTDYVTLSWRTVSGATGYEIQYRKSDGTFELWTGNPVSGTSATIRGLDDSTLYEFQVRAVNATTESGWSQTVPVTTLSLTPPTLTQAEFNEIRTKYADLNLSANMGDYNIIEIAADNLSDASLRAAIDEAALTAGDDLIVVRTTDTQNSITLTDGHFHINANATTHGSVTIVSLGTEKLTVIADRWSRVFRIGEGSTVFLAGLTITGGDAQGGGILNSGSLTVTHCTISENSAGYGGFGGGIMNLNSGTVTITNSTISGNSANNWYGGGIYNAGTMTVGNCVIAENSSYNSFGFGGSAGGGVFNDGAMTVMNTLIAKNSVDDHYSDVTHGGGIANTGTLTVLNSTITDNSATSDGGGIYNYHYFDDIRNEIVSGTITVNNTIIARNSSDVHNADITAVFAGNNNLIGNGAGQSSLINGINGNIVGTATNPIDPMFVDFDNADYRLASGSLAINAGNNAYNPAGMAIDLAGNTRIYNGTVDIGAYEHQGGTIVNPPTAPVNFRSTSQTSNSVTLAWDTQSGLTGYTLQYKKSDASDWTTWTSAPVSSATSATITGLTAGTAYEFRLTAINTGGSQSSETTATTANIPAADPVKPRVRVDARAATITSVTLIWAGNERNTDFAITCITPGVTLDPSQIGLTRDANGNINGAVISGLEPGKRYRFTVVAMNADGKDTITASNGRENSTAVNINANTLTARQAAVRASAVRAEATVDSVTVRWNVPTSGIDGYQIEIRGNGIREDNGRVVKNQLLATLTITVAADGKHEIAHIAVNVTLPTVGNNVNVLNPLASNESVIRQGSDIEIRNIGKNNVPTVFLKIEGLRAGTSYRFEIQTTGQSTAGEFKSNVSRVNASPMSYPAVRSVKVDVGSRTADSVGLNWQLPRYTNAFPVSADPVTHYQIWLAGNGSQPAVLLDTVGARLESGVLVTGTTITLTEAQQNTIGNRFENSCRLLIRAVVLDAENNVLNQSADARVSLSKA